MANRRFCPPGTIIRLAFLIFCIGQRTICFVRICWLACLMYRWLLRNANQQVFPPARRGREYRDSAYESRRTSQFTGGISLDNFRFISVLGRGHFGKVRILFILLIDFFPMVSLVSDMVYDCSPFLGVVFYVAFVNRSVQ